MTNKSALALVCVLVGGCGSVTAVSPIDAGDGAALEAAAAAGDVAGELGQVDAGVPELAPPRDAALEAAAEAPRDAMISDDVYGTVTPQCSGFSHIDECSSDGGTSRGQRFQHCYVCTGLNGQPLTDCVNGKPGAGGAVCVPSCTDCTAN